MLFFDEAGNSGENLLDFDQPSYLLLSHNYSEAEAKDILAPLLKISNAGELHFKSIRKYPSKHPALYECLNHPLIQETRAYFYVAHKPFMVAIQLVDKLIEPVLYDLGIDIYKLGRNIAAANYIYFSSLHHWDKILYKQATELFLKWNKTANTNDGKSFYNVLKSLGTKLGRSDEFLELLLASENQMESIADSFEKYGIDATLSCFIDHCHHWSKTLTGDFDIIFDHSKQITHWESMINYLNSMPSIEVGFGSRKHRYPLKIKSLNQVDSKTNLQLQLSDILASSLNYYFTSLIKEEESKLASSILKTRICQLIGNRMWPSINVSAEDLNMTNSDGINPLDFLANQTILRKQDYEKVKRKMRR